MGKNISKIFLSLRSFFGSSTPSQHYQASIQQHQKYNLAKFIAQTVRRLCDFASQTSYSLFGEQDFGIMGCTIDELITEICVLNQRSYTFRACFESQNIFQPLKMALFHPTNILPHTNPEYFY